MRSRRLTALVLVAAILLVSAVPTAVQQLAIGTPASTAFEYLPLGEFAFLPYTSTLSPTRVPDTAAPRGPPLS